ncbi:LptE family protein [Phocaeicola sp.]|uniref:LptE family protein n=1 Tax=Phocaeicola sp. TaxID=2773926 RepID=UPI003864944E
MVLIKKYWKILSSFVLVSCVLVACTVSYKFNGSSINYDKVKTISFENFPNRSAAFVWGPMESMFNVALQDKFMQQTRLKQVRQGGDLELSGEITNYDAYNKGIGSDGYSTMAELRMTVNVRFVNNTNHTEDFEQQFSASREYNASQQLSAVQEEYVSQMIDEIVEQIFNATVANW